MENLAINQVSSVIQNKIKVIQLEQPCPQIKNHSTTLYNFELYVFGGYDGKKNHNQLRIFNINSCKWREGLTTGNIPEGRNGHTATLIQDSLYIIGGWLGSGPYASSEVFLLNLPSLQWQICNTTGKSPGPCNMHSADLVENKIYVFRGGDGRDYLNDLHTLSIPSYEWEMIIPSTEYKPSQRANHSSTFLYPNLFIFGGWDGSKRLNDLYKFDITKNIWNEIKFTTSIPNTRAGMGSCKLNDFQWIIFGGSGNNAKCYNDL